MRKIFEGILHKSYWLNNSSHERKEKYGVMASNT